MVLRYVNEIQVITCATWSPVVLMYFFVHFSFKTVTYVVGCIVAGLIAYQFVLAVIGNRRIGEAKWANWFLLTSFARGSGRSKRAATRKINRLLQNASSMKPKTSDALEDYSVDTSEAIMINFVIRGEMFEDCGGLIWTWKQLYSGDLFEEEGVWIMSRLLVIQMIQALFISFKSYAYVLFIEGALQRCQKWQDDLRPGYPRWVRKKHTAWNSLYTSCSTTNFLLFSGL